MKVRQKSINPKKGLHESDKPALNKLKGARLVDLNLKAITYHKWLSPQNN